MSEQTITANEEWRPVPGFERVYEVSNLGRVRSLKFGKKKTMVGGFTRAGYRKVTFLLDGEQTTHLVHRLVVDAFLPHDPARQQTNHKNGNKADNRLENLERASPSDNRRHALDVLKVTIHRGSSHSATHLVERDVITMRQMERDGWSHRDIARRFAVSHGAVQAICSRKNWKHVRNDGCQDFERPGYKTACGECHRGHKLTNEQVLAIRELGKQPRSFRRIAKQFGISHDTVSRLVHGKAWKHLLKEKQY